MSAGCEWINKRKQHTEKRRHKWCNRSTSDIIEHCPQACGQCGCKDNEYLKFEVFAEGGSKLSVGCDWITEDGIKDYQIVNRFKKWCENSDMVRDNCPQTCGECTGIGSTEVQVAGSPSSSPTLTTSDIPTFVSSNAPSNNPTITSSNRPSDNPTFTSSNTPSINPTVLSSNAPSNRPTITSSPTISSAPSMRRKGGKGKTKGKGGTPVPTISPAPSSVAKGKKSSKTHAPGKIGKGGKGKKGGTSSPSLPPSMVPTASPIPSMVPTVECNKPTGSKELGVAISFIADPSFTKKMANSVICTNLEPTSNQVSEILSAKAETLEKLDEGMNILCCIFFCLLYDYNSSIIFLSLSYISRL